MRKFVHLVLILMLLIFSLTAQPSLQSVTYNQQSFAMLHAPDSTISESVPISEKMMQKKSGVKAALFSAIIPGAGEVYAGSYWKAIAFAALEIGFWTANIIYENKGDDEDRKMRAFGDQHWSEEAYWAHIYQLAQDNNLWNGNDLPLINDEYGRIVFGEGYYTPDLVEQLRGLAFELGYTHSLPSGHTQQYYEMIYKYLHQFGVGWDDVKKTFNDPWYYDIPTNLSDVTPNIDTYRKMRNRSNDYYGVATTMLNLILVNHLLSALDAAWSVKKYNLRISQTVRMHQTYETHMPVIMYGLNIQW